MKFSLIVCTYQRPKALIELLNSVLKQTLYPNELIIVDGSLDCATKDELEKNNYKNLRYYKVEETDRGLTKQRNYGISKVSNESEVICFLDDDTILDSFYFENLIKTYHTNMDAIGVGGYIANEVIWTKANNMKCGNEYFCFGGYRRKEATRFKIRKFFGLDSNVSPGFMPNYSHGRPISYLPPSNKTYKVEFFMGGIASFKKSIFNKLEFSTYFKGYGLYEDLDFCLRVSQKGQLYVNTAAKLEHHHAQEGRPNSYAYGKMVLRNGWYVWRVKYPTPNLKAQFKWHTIALLLTLIRLSNVLTTKQPKQAFTESLGRMVGWLSLIMNKPIHKT